MWNGRISECKRRIWCQEPQELPEHFFSFAQEGIADLLKPLQEQKSNLFL